MLRRTLCQADVTLELEPVDPILVKSGYASLEGPDMAPVITYRSGKPECYFPGSSLKGVLRSHLERIARTLNPDSVCIPYYDPQKNISVPVPQAQHLYGCGFRSRDEEDSTAQRYSDSCAACRMFGSLKFGGRFSISDAYPLPDQQPVLEERNGVGIDRFTGGTVRGILFNLQVLTGGCFRTQVRLLNFELWQLAALYFLLLDLQDEQIAIGSGRSRGLGRVRGRVADFRLSYIPPVENLQGLYQLANKQERACYGLHDWEPEKTIPLPAAEPRGLRRCFDITEDWHNKLALLAPAFEEFLNWHGGPKGNP